METAAPRMTMSEVRVMMDTGEDIMVVYGATFFCSGLVERFG